MSVTADTLKLLFDMLTPIADECKTEVYKLRKMSNTDLLMYRFNNKSNNSKELMGLIDQIAKLAIGVQSDIALTNSMMVNALQSELSTLNTPQSNQVPVQPRHQVVVRNTSKSVNTWCSAAINKSQVSIPARLAPKALLSTPAQPIHTVIRSVVPNIKVSTITPKQLPNRNASGPMRKTNTIKLNGLILNIDPAVFVSVHNSKNYRCDSKYCIAPNPNKACKFYHDPVFGFNTDRHEHIISMTDIKKVVYNMFDANGVLTDYTMRDAMQIATMLVQACATSKYHNHTKVNKYSKQ